MTDATATPESHGAGFWVRLLVAATALRVVVAFGAFASMPFRSDALAYHEFALSLSRSFPGTKPYFWPPGWPFVLAAIYSVAGPTIVVAKLVVLFFSVATVALVAHVATGALGATSEARSAAWLACFYAPAILLGGQTYSQHFAAFTLLGVALFGMTAIREARLLSALLAGVCFGWGVLTRPSMGSIAIVVLSAVVFRLVAAWRAQPTGEVVRLMTVAALFILGGASLVLPVQRYNSVHGAGWTISTNNERNFFLGNNVYTPDYKTSQLADRPIEELPVDVRAYLQSVYSRPDSRDAMMHEAGQFIHEHPWRTAVRTLNRIKSFWGFDYLATRSAQLHFGWRTATSCFFLALEAGAYGFVVVLALIAIVAYRSVIPGPWLFWLIGLTLAYLAPYAIAFSSGTYHFPVMPLLMPLAGVAAARLRRPNEWRALVSDRQKARMLAIVLVAFLGLQVEYAYYLIVHL